MSADYEIQDLVSVLLRSGCSLVVRDTSGTVAEYSKPGVRDLVWLLDHEPCRLLGATVADKVVGRAAAGLLAVGGAQRVHALVMSRGALPVLDKAGITHSCTQLVDKIVVPQSDTRCRLEKIVETADTPHEIERLLRAHFKEMELKRKHHQ